jgi:hypothetical protein
MAAAMAAVQASHDSTLDKLLGEWEPIQAAQIEALATQIERLVDDNDLAGLPDMTVPTEHAERTLTGALTEVGRTAAEQVAHEAAQQDALVVPYAPDAGVIAQIAQGAVLLAAADLVTGAAAEAMRVNGPGMSGRDVAQAVTGYLRGEVDGRHRAPVARLFGRLKDRLSGAVHKGQHAGRVATMRKAPVTAYYGSEINDANRCGPCAEVDGRWLGNTIAEAEAEYPTGGYIRCAGRDRCRGHIVAVYRPKQTEES